MENGAQALAPNDEHVIAEHPDNRVLPAPARTRRAPSLGRVRIPLALAYRPWATAYRLPDGRTIWCLRVWAIDRAVTVCASTSTLATYCWRSRLDAVAREVERIGGP